MFSDAYFVISNPENNEDFTMAIIRELNGHSPKFGENCFIAENAATIGKWKWAIIAVFGMVLYYGEMYII